MNNDAELLRRYVEERAEDAFTELVQRHLGLVYTTALRRVGYDAHLAEDVAQTVFTDLARKAASLRGRATISGWLYISTHLASAAVVRVEQRRKTRETEAQTMQTLLHESGGGPDWDHLRPLLDEVIVNLRDDEREAIALRFFEKRSFAEVGAALRLTEEAARKRVERALEKLRSLLARRGVTSTTATLALALGGFCTGAAPAGLASKIAGHAFAQGATVSAGTATLAMSVLVGAALLVGVVAVSNQYRANRQLATELAQLDVDRRAIAAVRNENLNLLRVVAEADDLRRGQTELPGLRAALQPKVSVTAAQAPAQATVTVQPDGRIMWGREAVSLKEFLARLNTLQQGAPNLNAKLGIRGLSEFSPLAYVIDEARKAQIEHVVVNSSATPDPKLGFSWFGWR